MVVVEVLRSGGGISVRRKKDTDGEIDKDQVKGGNRDKNENKKKKGKEGVNRMKRRGMRECVRERERERERGSWGREEEEEERNPEGKKRREYVSRWMTDTEKRVRRARARLWRRSTSNDCYDYCGCRYRDKLTRRLLEGRDLVSAGRCICMSAYLQ